MAQAKNKANKEESSKKYWKIMAPGWIKPVLRPKDGTPDRVLKSIKAKKGYTVEEA